MIIFLICLPRGIRGFKGVRYTIKADEEFVKARREQLDKRQKELRKETGFIFNREEYIDYLSQDLYALLM